MASEVMCPRCGHANRLHDVWLGCRRDCVCDHAPTTPAAAAAPLAVAVIEQAEQRWNDERERRHEEAADAAGEYFADKAVSDAADPVPAAEPAEPAVSVAAGALASWPAWLCEDCGSRYLQPRVRCCRPLVAVTVTITRRAA